MADLKAARANAWERLRMLVGQRSYLYKFPEKLTGPLPERLEPRKQIESEIKELIALLAPGATLEFAVYEPGAENDGLKYVAASENGFKDSDYKWIAARMSNPIDPSIAPPAPDRATDDVAADLLIPISQSFETE